MHVSKVRKKLGDSDNGSDHIKTVRGVGYIFAHPRDHAKTPASKGERA
jgi:DNA-binding response OmpR family regulator